MRFIVLIISRFMMNLFTIWNIIILLFVSCLNISSVLSQKHIVEDIEEEFRNPPSSVRVGAYWYWIDGNISKEGVLKDLEAMKKAGITRAFIGNIGGHGMGDPKGVRIKIFSDEWWDITKTALKKASELGIEIGFFNSPGWSQSGGPWVKSNEAMRFLASTQTIVRGPGKMTIQLEKASNASKVETLYMTPDKGMVSAISDKPIGKFEDVKVLAYPVRSFSGEVLTDNMVRISSSPLVDHIERLLDHKVDSGIVFPSGETFSILLEADTNFVARSLTIYPNPSPINTLVRFQVLVNKKYKTVADFSINRTNPRITAGYEPWAPVVISLPAISSNSYRLEFERPMAGSGIAEIELSSRPKIERYKEKILAKMVDGSNPRWEDYTWREQPEVNDRSLVVDPCSVIDLSDKMSTDGVLNWEVPDGEWVVLRTGMLLTGTVNAPAMPDATGWEVDKMNRKHVESHFNAFIGKILSCIPLEERKAFKVVVQDSYETGGQNFTDDFLEEFESVYGYDPVPYLPAYFGTVVGSEEESDRFLWDIRRFIADKVAKDYVGGLRSVCHKHGLTTWLENYGHFGFPGEFLQYGGQSDEVSGEFWAGGSLMQIENELAASCAHIYGKNLVSSESSTGGGPAYSFTPATLKQGIDCSFTKGINSTIFHVYIQQPTDSVPGFNAWFGTEFNRNNTWFEQMDLYTDYIKRCNYMLRLGNPVSDVAYYIGEDAPKMDGVRDPELPFGYKFDYINSEILLRDMYVSNGALKLPHGVSYRVLVLPKMETMRPEVIEKIERLIRDGAVVIGSSPKRSPSLKDRERSDRYVKEIALRIWGNVDGIRTYSRKYGEGTIYDGVSLQYVFSQIDCLPDMTFTGDYPISFFHRKMGSSEIYYVANLGDKAITTDITFRVHSLQPELWDPLTGRQRHLPAFVSENGQTTVPISMERGESFFIVFREKGKSKSRNLEANFPEPHIVSSANKPWNVNFESQIKPPYPIRIDSLLDLSTYLSDAVKYFSGKAIYETTLSGTKVKENETVFLDLGRVSSMAKVKLNGEYVGGVWTYPYLVDVTDHIREGENQLEIEVVNTWVNRIIGDMKLPLESRDIDILFNPYNAGSRLMESGLIGPVTLKKVSYRK